MKTFTTTLVLLASLSTASVAAEDWITRESASSVDATADRLVEAVEGAGATLFARVDHAAGAQSVGQELPPTTLVIFGNPKVGTAIMQADPRAGLDLPMRVLVWQEDGRTMIGYEDPEALKARYAIEGADPSFATMAAALEKLTTVAAE
ncbi:DUF302 domain-containing protein [Marinivivus vitaminiproducens]|uniref:DUF302 domain-containing protein n=1 Tax=Marinivivus vitaminiproducens TaxID=3035935 RepID=UPI00279E1407|nr:DUF302 domain-containing protein [Geminicoccaceae bacterium SCSIO 64248]